MPQTYKAPDLNKISPPREPQLEIPPIPQPPTRPKMFGIASVGFVRFLSVFSTSAAQRLQQYNLDQQAYQERLDAVREMLAQQQQPQPQQQQQQPQQQPQQQQQQQPQQQPQPAPQTKPQLQSKAITVDELMADPKEVPKKGRPKAPPPGEKPMTLEELQQLPEDVITGLLKKAQAVHKELTYELQVGNVEKGGKSRETAQAQVDSSYTTGSISATFKQHAQLIGVLYGMGYSLEEILEPDKRPPGATDKMKETAQLLLTHANNPSQSVELMQLFNDGARRILEEGVVPMDHQASPTEIAKHYPAVYLRSEVLPLINEPLTLGIADEIGIEGKINTGICRQMTEIYKVVRDRFKYLHRYNDQETVLKEFKEGEESASYGLTKLVEGELYADNYGKVLNGLVGRSFQLDPEANKTFEAYQGAINQFTKDRPKGMGAGEWAQVKNEFIQKENEKLPEQVKQYLSFKSTLGKLTGTVYGKMAEEALEESSLSLERIVQVMTQGTQRFVVKELEKGGFALSIEPKIPQKVKETPIPAKVV